MSNKFTIYLEDCRTSMALRQIVYDYVLCSPPDFDELSMHPKTDYVAYFDFVASVINLFSPSNSLVTFVVTDRKFKSSVIAKHAEIIEIMKSAGYRLVSQKIWMKSDRLNLYRLTYAFIMTFSNASKYRQNHYKDYEYDVWRLKDEKYKMYQYGFPSELAHRCILNFTSNDDTVFDCFLGSGTTGVTTIECGRDFIGCEINPKIYELAKSRLDLCEMQFFKNLNTR